jgi:hypothetical protein
MMAHETAFSSFVGLHGIPLDCLGFSERALMLSDAWRALGLARQIGILILGGDLYARAGDAIAHAYAGWHTDRLPTETYGEFLERSWDRAEQYLARLPPCAEGREHLVVLVTG